MRSGLSQPARRDGQAPRSQATVGLGSPSAYNLYPTNVPPVVRKKSMLLTSSTAYTGSRSLPRSTRTRDCALSLSIYSSTLPFPSGARVSMKTDPGTLSDARKRFEASAAASCEYPVS